LLAISAGKEGWGATADEADSAWKADNSSAAKKDLILGKEQKTVGFSNNLVPKAYAEWTIPYGFGHECSGSGEIPYRLSCDSRYADTIMTGGANAYDMPAKGVNKPTLNFPLLKKGLKIMEG
jgi:hypothetical protein